jgi:hypothetical protein
LRDRIIETATAGVWTDHDFTKIRDVLAVFSVRGFGNKKAWSYVFDQINVGLGGGCGVMASRCFGRKKLRAWLLAAHPSGYLQSP